MTVTDAIAVPPADRYALVAVDLYRDIHKGIRAELFAATGEAARLDPADHLGRVALAEHVGSVVGVLRSHAEHEDTAVQPTLVVELPELAEQVEADHEVLERRMDVLVELGAAAVAAAPGDERRRVAELHLELASFTGAYLAHQDVEERVIMPALDAAVGPEACLAINQAIVSSIPPEEMAASLAFMIPAMNLDDRTELLGGMQAGAPPEVFAQVWGLVESVLPVAEVKPLGARLGVA